MDKVVVNIYGSGRRSGRGRLVLAIGRRVRMEDRVMATVQIQVPVGFGVAVEAKPTFKGKKAKLDGRPTVDFQGSEDFELIPDPTDPDDDLKGVLVARGEVGATATAILTADARVGPERVELKMVIDLTIVPVEADTLDIVVGGVVELPAADGA